MWSIKHRLTGCQSCGTSEVPHRAHGMCRNCYAKAKGYVWQKKYQQQNKEKHAEYNRAWNAANPASVNRARTNWRLRNDQAQRKYLKTWRKKNKAPFCIICGEDRVAEWAHLIACKDGGPVSHWNLIPLCPTHHRCFDANLLTEQEASVIFPYLTKAKEEFSKLK